MYIRVFSLFFVTKCKFRIVIYHCNKNYWHCQSAIATLLAYCSRIILIDEPIACIILVSFLWDCILSMVLSSPNWKNCTEFTWFPHSGMQLWLKLKNIQLLRYSANKMPVPVRSRSAYCLYLKIFAKFLLLSWHIKNVSSNNNTRSVKISWFCWSFS